MAFIISIVFYLYFHLSFCLCLGFYDLFEILIGWRLVLALLFLSFLEFLGCIITGDLFFFFGRSRILGILLL